jgi:thymidine kinase
MSLEIVLGPMFAGKSSYVLSTVRRNAAIGIRVLVVKPRIDVRYAAQEVVTHDDARTECIVVENLIQARAYADRHQIIVVEEAQFFPDLFDFVTYNVDTLRKRVILIGLDGDSQRQPFGQLLQCIPLADEITKLKALCAVCRDGTPAIFTYRRSIVESQIHIGGADEYSPLCRACYINEST